jgi:hypothetical protein
MPVQPFLVFVENCFFAEELLSIRPAVEFILFYSEWEPYLQHLSAV